MPTVKTIADELGIESAIEPASVLTTFKGGGEATVLYPDNAAKLIELLRMLNAYKMPFFILGGGSNVIIRDGKSQAAVISTSGLTALTECGTLNRCGLVRAEAGAKINEVRKFALKRGCGGLEFLCGVPATVGGAVRMNAGAFGHNIGDYLYKLIRLTADYAQIEEITAENTPLGYRKGCDGIIIAAEFILPYITVTESSEICSQYIKSRSSKQPKFPSCGSVFKNPRFEGAESAGKYIEDCGLKGTVCGGAEISRLHANFIVNTGGASAVDFLTLVELAEKSVHKKFGVTLEREFVLM